MQVGQKASSVSSQLGQYANSTVTGPTVMQNLPFSSVALAFPLLALITPTHGGGTRLSWFG